RDTPQQRVYMHFRSSNQKFRPLALPNYAESRIDNLPRKTSKRKIYLTHEQVNTMAASAGAWSTLILLLSYCGLRWGEAVGLRISDLDMLRRRVNVARNAVQVGARIELGTPKSNKSRSIPIPAFLVEDLAVQCIGKPRDGLVFPGVDGGFLRRPNSERGWFRSAARARPALTSSLHTIYGIRQQASQYLLART
ncbi:tyrosine-type recombinase/integrase, partial [Rhodococcus jostii]|uniref:tyrosine-type recombinase/integrase n=1 Tax=Rhodococcus jostii TaxID=132919 RepID=UPI00363185EC